MSSRDTMSGGEGGGLPAVVISRIMAVYLESSATLGRPTCTHIHERNRKDPTSWSAGGSGTTVSITIASLCYSLLFKPCFLQIHQKSRQIANVELQLNVEFPRSLSGFNSYRSPCETSQNCMLVHSQPKPRKQILL